MGYVTDTAYIRSVSPDLLPEWLDLVALINGFAPPQGERRTWCELGCGRALTAIIAAATHPPSQHHAVDLMPVHIAEAKRVADAAGVTNLHLHEGDFAAAAALDLPRFDYIVAHGVYAWIDEAAAATFRAFIDRHLAPGGLVYVSYNAMPGWAGDAPFQHLLRSLAVDLPGDSNARFAAAVVQARSLADAAPSALAKSEQASGWDAHSEKLPVDYFAHEYLAPAWRPRYSDEFRDEMATIGLAPIGTATLYENFDGFALGKAAREALATLPPGNKRELMRDYYLSQRFRRDVLGRGVRHLADDERRERLLAMRLVLLGPASEAIYAMRTGAGRVSFDNEVARHIVACLAGGPRRLGDCVGGGHHAQNVVANALTLLCAGVARVAAAHDSDVDRLNRVLREEYDPRDALVYRVLCCGVPLRFGTALLDRCAAPAADDARAVLWADYLAAMDSPMT